MSQNGCSNLLGAALAFCLTLAADAGDGGACLKPRDRRVMKQVVGKYSNRKGKTSRNAARGCLQTASRLIIKVVKQRFLAKRDFAYAPGAASSRARSRMTRPLQASMRLKRESGSFFCRCS